MSWGTRIFRCSALLLVAGLAGCNSDPRAQVSGTVNLDGTPLDNATIMFVPNQGGQNKAGWAKIEDGQYTIPAKNGLGIGSFRVEVRAPRPVKDGVPRSYGPMPGEAFVDLRDIIPERYNRNSELTAEIASGDNVANFDLKSK